jgi:hypothetical protein
MLGLKPVVESVAARYSSMLEVNPASLTLNFVQSGRVSIGMDFNFFLKQYLRIIKTMRAIDSQNMIHKWPLSQAIPTLRLILACYTFDARPSAPVAAFRRGNINVRAAVYFMQDASMRLSNLFIWQRVQS